MKRLRVVENGEAVIITAFADYNPLQRLNKISAELENIRFRGPVVFDLLCTNGDSNNRFVKLIFDGLKFDRKSFLVINEIDKKLKEEQDVIFRNHPDLLAESVLSSSELAQF